MTHILIALSFTFLNALIWGIVENAMNGRVLTTREWFPVFAYASTNVMFMDWLFG